MDDASDLKFEKVDVSHNKKTSINPCYTLRLNSFHSHKYFLLFIQLNRLNPIHLNEGDFFSSMFLCNSQNLFQTKIKLSGKKPHVNLCHKIYIPFYPSYGFLNKLLDFKYKKMLKESRKSFSSLFSNVLFVEKYIQDFVPSELK